MTDFGKEMHKLQKMLGLKQQEIGKMLGINDKSYRGRIYGRYEFKLSELEKLEKYLKEKGVVLDSDEFPLLTKKLSGHIINIVNRTGKVQPFSIEDIKKSAEKIWEEYGFKRDKAIQYINESTIPIPKLQCTVSAGGGNHIEGIDTFETNGTLIIDKDTLRVDYKNLRAIKVDGYSMIPVLMPDSWVIFDDTDHFTGDGLYIINFRNILMVKTLQVNSEGKLRIISANKEYESYTIDLDDQSTFKIFGKVRRCII